MQDNAFDTIEILTFIIGGEEYGIDILKVKEIRAYETVTKIANTPPFIIGVINLRGIIVPIIDIRVKFNLIIESYDQFTVIIILNLSGRLIGMLVDRVTDVLTLKTENILPAPALNSNLEVPSVFGVGAVGGRMIILADLERWLLAEVLFMFDKPEGLQVSDGG